MHRHSRGFGLLIAGLLFAAVGVVIGAGTAFASHWLTDGAKKAGDSNVRFDNCELANNTHDAFHNNDTHDIEVTVITSSNFHSCDTVDVRINDWPFGTDDPTGWYECHLLHSANNCDHGHVHINTSYSDIPEDYSRTLRLVCEEIGHSVGLGHSGQDGSCMSGTTAAHLNDHDKTSINNGY